MVVNGGWLPTSPNLVKCRPRRYLANPLVKGLFLVNRVLLIRPNHIISGTSSLLWCVLCRQVRLSAPLGEGVGLVLLFQILGMAGVEGCGPWERPWYWSSTSTSGWLPESAPFCTRQSLGGGMQPVIPYLQLEASLRPCSLDLLVL
jgi:hypothetical protein